METQRNNKHVQNASDKLHDKAAPLLLQPNVNGLLMFESIKKRLSSQNDKSMLSIAGILDTVFCRSGLSGAVLVRGWPWSNL